MRTFLVLLGDVADVSLVHQQLDLRSFAELHIKNGRYLDPLEDALPLACAQMEARHVCLGTPTPNVADLARALDQALPGWRLGSELILYPLAMYFRQPEALDAVLAKLCAVPFAARLRHGELSLLKIGSKQLLQDAASSRLADVAVDSDQMLDANVVDLNSAMGLFEVATTQTATRTFNTFASRLPYIVKQTTNVAKGRDEYAYLSALPAALRAYFPQVGAAEGDETSYAYEIEFVPMLDLGRFWIHGSLPRDLDVVLREVAHFRDVAPRKQVGQDHVRQELHALFVDKLAQRMVRLLALPSYPRLHTASLALHPQGVLGLAKALTARLEALVKRLPVSDALIFSHGDLCLSNILFDRTSSRIKLIDPRGLRHAFLPAYYDVCKLSHSLRGRYDFVINGLAHLDYDDALQLRLRTPSLAGREHAAVVDKFAAWCAKLGLDAEMVRLGEASLFLSMMPLHDDFPARMLQQACIARELMD